MPIPTADNLFLRDPRNRAFVDGDRDRHKPRYPDDTHPAFSLFVSLFACAIVSVGAVITFAEARSTFQSACGPAPEIACYFSGPYALWPCVGAFVLLLAVVTARELITAVRFPARVRRLGRHGE
jgi:hypothetical protein